MTILQPDGTPAAPSQAELIKQLKGTEGMMSMVAILRNFDKTMVYSMISILDSRIFDAPDIDLIKVLGGWSKSTAEEAMLRAYCLSKGIPMQEGDVLPELDASHQTDFKEFLTRHSVMKMPNPQPFHKLVIISPEGGEDAGQNAV